MTKLFTTPRTSGFLSLHLSMQTEYVWDGAKESDLHTVFAYPIPREAATEMFSTGNWLPAYSLQELHEWVFRKSGYELSKVQEILNTKTAEEAGQLLIKTITKR